MPSIQTSHNALYSRYWAILTGVILLSVSAAILLKSLIILFVPAFFFGAYLVFKDFKQLYFLLFFTIPFSSNIRIGSNSIDLPSEPLILLLTGISLIYFLANYHKISFKFITHPISLLLMMHLGWTFITTLTSEQFSFSAKFFAAKIWYIIPFYFLPAKILYQDKSYKRWIFVGLVAIFITLIYVMFRHYTLGFTFEEINWALGPFYPNHVIYASLLTLFLPYIWESLAFFKRKSLIWWIIIGTIFLFIVAIKLSFTRAAYISVFALVGAYWMIRFNFLKYALIAGVIISAIGVRWIVQDNHYLDYAPDYERTISNKEFGDLVDATYKLEDISVMERVYRWVAAFRMASDHPYMGFGPGNFYSFYKPYTLRLFKTYVSDNPEHSGVHCYFLMTTVEQGFLGLFFFVAFMLGVIVVAEKAYHLEQDPVFKRRIMANVLTFLAICSFLIINDMIEVDKIGSFFFISAAMIVRLHIRAQDVLKTTL